MDLKPAETHPSKPETGEIAEESRQRGYPLVAILLLTTAVATALACLDIPKLRDLLANNRGTVLGIFVLASGLAGLLGAAIGLGSKPRWRGSIKGLGLGLAIGGFLGILIMAPAHPIQSFVAVTVLVLASLALKWHTV